MSVDDNPLSSPTTQPHSSKGQLELKAEQRLLDSAAKTIHSTFRSRLTNHVLRFSSHRLALVASGIFLGLFLLMAAVLPFTPTAINTDSPARNSPTLLTVLLIIVNVAWGASAYFRCSDVVIRKYIYLIAIMLIVWSIMTLAKYCAYRPLLESLLWYCYYPPMIFIPTLLLFCSLHVAAPDNTAVVIWLKRVTCVISLILSVLVLTNNVHYLAFIFSFENSNWLYDYHYGPVYFAIFAWLALLIGAFFCVLIISARKQLRKALVFLAGIAVLFFTFAILNILRVNFVIHMPLTVTIELIYIVVVELCLGTGLFPMCSDYQQAFSELPFDVKLVSLNGKQTMQSLMATEPKQQILTFARCALVDELSSDALNSTKEFSMLARPIITESHLSAQAAFRLPLNPDESYKAYQVLGGVAVVTKDMRTLNKRKENLSKQQKMLHEQNMQLERYRAAQTEFYRKQSENRLYQSIEESLSSTVAEIAVLLNAIKPLNEHATFEQRDTRRRILLLVKLLVSYCKRKGGLVLFEQQNLDYERDRLNLIINETLSDVRPAGADCAALIETDDILPTPSISVCCDCLYAFAIASIDCKDATIMLFMQNKNESFISLNIMLDAKMHQTKLPESCFTELEQSLLKSGLSYQLLQEGTTTSLSVLLPRRRW